MFIRAPIWILCLTCLTPSSWSNETSPPQMAGDTQPPDIQIVAPTPVAPRDAPAAPASAHREGRLCGGIEYDGVNGFNATRALDIGLESWVLAPCQTGDTPIRGFEWLAATPWGWTDTVDWAVWDARTVENGCANDSTALWIARDVPASQLGVYNPDGTRAMYSGNVIWHYVVFIDPILPMGDIYIGVRPVMEANSSYVMSRRCDVAGRVFFQSEFFGFPCATPSEDIFGGFYCASIAAFSDGADVPNACCLSDQTCTQQYVDNCRELDGFPLGFGTECRDAPCPHLRATDRSGGRPDGSGRRPTLDVARKRLADRHARGPRRPRTELRKGATDVLRTVMPTQVIRPRAATAVSGFNALHLKVNAVKTPARAPSSDLDRPTPRPRE